MTANSDTSAGGRIYYPGPGIVVTRRYIETAEGRFPVRELSIEDPSYIYTHPARVVALYCGAVELLLAAGLAAIYGSGEALIGTAGVLSATGLTSALWLDDRRNPRHMELTAWHEGRRVILFTSDDQQTFEQVKRAVIRAREANERPRP